MKKTLFIIFGFLLLTGGLHAQQMSLDNEKNNCISVELSAIFPGIGASYEHILSSKISFGAKFYWNTLPSFIIEGFPNVFGIDTFFRYYPWGKTFFLSLALGFGYIVYEDYDDNLFGVAITPEIGWKIDIGNTDGFYLQPGLAWSFIFGEGWENKFTILGAPARLYLGLGYRF